MTRDVLVPEGVVLTILPGTTIHVSPSESTKTDPEYMSPLTEITVRGTLRAEGTRESPIVFVLSGGDKSPDWAGIIVDGGKVSLRSCRIQNAETGLYVVGGSVRVKDSILMKNRYGLVVQGMSADVSIDSAQVKDNDYGIFLLGGAKVESKGTLVEGNRKKDNYSSPARNGRFPEKEYKEEKKDGVKVYGDDALLGTTVWQGKIEVNGVLRVPEGARLVVMPGTTIEFGKKDTDGDNIGENGILVMGLIIAKGTPERPIIFRSAEARKKMGDWDSINIMDSDRAQNLIEYCQIEDAYRGLHFHFSNVAVKGSILKNNYRGIQFQESTVEIAGTYIYGNKSGLQARDSDVVFSGNYVFGNYSGINLFRCNVTAKDNRIADNYKEGLRLREGVPIVEGNLIDGNRYGLMISGSVYGKFSGNVVSHNLESGISLKRTDNIEVSGNAVQGNGFNGINIQDSAALIEGNLVSDNGERGIGIMSFEGVITGNNIAKNGTYALGIDGQGDVSAGMNWWGGDSPARVIFDKESDPSKGKAHYKPFRNKPISFLWPLKTIETDTIWRGDIVVKGNTTLTPGTNLAISPFVNVLFSKGAGLAIRGKITACGKKNARITFTSEKPGGPGYWDEIFLEHADGSVFSHCTFENADWALHIHFTDLHIEDCIFARNYGGIRFRSGPIEIRHSLFKGDVIGLRSYRGNASIFENVITGNETGIFVREKGGGLKIRRNNIFDNSEYNVRVGDFNDEDVDAKDNWWGRAAPTEKIYDARREPGIGKVKFEPYSKERFKIDVSGGDNDEIWNCKKQPAAGKTEN